MAKITEVQAYEYLHRCRYCDEYTGDDTTGCAGRPTPCHCFCLDWITIPRWALDFRYLFEDEEAPGEDDWWNY